MKTGWMLNVAVLALLVGSSALAADQETAVLDPFTVKADRIEQFGFDLAGPGQPLTKDGPPTWTIHFVMPHTAAAKVGLKPGDRVVKLDGQPVTFRAWREWAEIRGRKRRAADAGERVTWSLEVESPVTKEVRSVTLAVPTPAPHWGGAVWHAPEDRAPAVVAEAGPLAELARVVMNNGVWTGLGWPFLAATLAPEWSGKGGAPFLAFYWMIFDESGRPHKIAVTQQRGRTDVLLTVGASGRGNYVEYLTSPSGALEEAIAFPGRKPLAPQKAASGFEQEVEFWTKKVGRASPRWPLELLPRETTATPKRE